MKQQTKILWVTRHRLSVARQSGTPYYMREALAWRGAQIVTLDGLSPKCFWEEKRWPTIGLTVACARLVPDIARERARGKRLDWDRSPALARYYATVIQHAIQKHKPDVIIGDKAYVEFAFLKTHVPVVYLHDALAEDLMDYGSYFRQFGARSRSHALMLQRQALTRSAARVFSSAWAARACATYYPSLPGPTRVVYNGPCLDEQDIPSAWFPHEPTADPAHVLLVGVDWHRKDMATAIDMVDQVRQASKRNIVLDLCGLDRVPSGIQLPAFVHCHGRLDKRDKTQREQLLALYRQALFFLLPSREECLAQSCIEALAFGVPCIVRDVGGQREVTDDGAAGFIFREKREWDTLLPALVAYMNQPDKYHQLSGAAFDLSCARFAWHSWAESMESCIEAALDPNTSASGEARDL